MAEFSNLELIENQSKITTAVDGIKSITDSLPNSGTLSSLGTLANQSLALTDTDNLVMNTSSLIGSNATIDNVVDGIKTNTDNLPDSGALTSLAQVSNQTLISNANATIDYIVDALKIIIDRLPDDGNLSSLASMRNQTCVLHNLEHFGNIFPEDTGRTITFYTGAANTYGPYNVIKDSQNNTFSAKFNNTAGYISSILLEDASALDITYMFEISYGASHTPLFESRIHSATNQVGPAAQTRFRVLSNPAGEVLYYRGMCENASANAQVSFRYHLPC